MTGSPASPPHASLRDRKRRATLVAIEDAATALVLEHGFDAVTVEQICARADVAKRTFFNYVVSKEAAVIGSPPERVTAGDRAAFLAAADPDVPAAVLRVFLASFAAARSGDDAHTAALVQRRRSIFRDHPDLAAARMTATSRFHQDLVDLVVDLFSRHPELRRLPGVPADAEGRACVALVAAATTLGVTSWLGRESGTFTDLDADCATALDHLADLVGTADRTGGPA